MNKEQMVGAIKSNFSSWEEFTNHLSTSPEVLWVSGWRVCKAKTSELSWLTSMLSGGFIYAEDVQFTKTLSYSSDYEYIYTDSYQPDIVTAGNVLKGEGDVKVYY